jgi:undecaprenyl-diphosphatase
MWATAGSVGIARIYVGAHLPLDVVGGMALGAMIGMTVSTRRDETN